jgi:hypothetical protein
MAFKVVQTFKFGEVEYSYDRKGDVLDISFGPPTASIALQVEDWLAMRIRANPPALAGMTIVGFRKISEQIDRYAEKELPHRMKRLARVEMAIAYDDGSDTLIMRFEEKASLPRRLLQKLSLRGTARASIFEPLVGRGGPAATLESSAQPMNNVYVEKSIPSKDFIGIKILQYTKCGAAALEGILGAIVDMLFEPGAQQDENVHLITTAVVRRLDWRKFAALPT